VGRAIFTVSSRVGTLEDRIPALERELEQMKKLKTTAKQQRRTKRHG
jgi:hypothetical protein